MDRRAEHFADIGSKVQCKSDDSYIYAVDIDLSKEHIEHKHQKDEHRCTTHYRNVDICNTGQPFPAVHLHPAYERTKKSSKKDAEDGNYDSGLQSFENEHVAVLMDDVADETVLHSFEKALITIFRTVGYGLVNRSYYGPCLEVRIGERYIP